jgi:hypothetical protein
MPVTGFEPTIRRAKKVHALDRAATVIGTWSSSVTLYVIHIINLINQTVKARCMYFLISVERDKGRELLVFINHFPAKFPCYKFVM